MAQNISAVQNITHCKVNSTKYVSIRPLFQTVCDHVTVKY